MADLTRTEYGRIGNQGKYMLNHKTLICYFGAGYKNLFSPYISKSCYFAQNLTGCHSEVFAETRYRISSRKKAA